MKNDDGFSKSSLRTTLSVASRGGSPVMTRNTKIFLTFPPRYMWLLTMDIHVLSLVVKYEHRIQEFMIAHRTPYTQFLAVKASISWYSNL